MSEMSMFRALVVKAFFLAQGFFVLIAPLFSEHHSLHIIPLECNQKLAFFLQGYEKTVMLQATQLLCLNVFVLYLLNNGQ